MANREGAIHRGLSEWGSKARKMEADLRGTNNRARREAIAEQVEDIEEEENVSSLWSIPDEHWAAGLNWFTEPGDRAVSWTLA
jgi:hypothetical protein